MLNKPYTFELSDIDATMTRYDKHIQRPLSAMRGQYHDVAAYEALLATGDIELYQVYENTRPAAAGELPHGLSILHPGRVGDEYFMTKGHFHRVLETGEVYHCLQGHGMIVMETPEGDWAVEELTPGRVLYIPPRWAHRSVNIGDGQDLVTFYIYPGNAGHDYGTIEQKGFRKLVVAGPDGPQIVDNPRWGK
ncbi:MAG: glucose-6-phosphate isomerase [Caldilineaceae bacterium]|nr:glucose-6-phosphate isomerase [Caldilineaceae bacterium]MCB9149052.1 glucose-6-phosphate isomerase [Caldilineaceae bacterium]